MFADIHLLELDQALAGENLWKIVEVGLSEASKERIARLKVIRELNSRANEQ